MMKKILIFNICETWLNSNIPDEIVNIDGYHCLRNDRKDRQGGGVLTYVTSSIPTKIITETIDEDIESLWILIRPKQLPRKFSPIIIVNVYHPPNKPNDPLEQHLIKGLDYLVKKHPYAGIIVTGDFNQFRSKHQWTTSYHLKQIITQPTRKNAILDLFFTNMVELYTDVTIEEPIGNSDHNTIVVTPIFKYETIQHQTTTKRDQRMTNRANTIQELEKVDWTALYMAESLNDKFQIFSRQLEEVIDVCLPWVTSTRPNQCKPWVTDDFLRVIKLRNKHWHLNRYGNTFKYFRNKANRMRNNLRRIYLTDRTNNLKDPKKWWTEIKQLTCSGNKDVLLPLINNLFNSNISNFVNAANDFFVSVAHNIKPLNLNLFPELQTPELIPDHFLPTVNKIRMMLGKTNIKKAIGPDNIPNWIWKDCNHVLAGPVTAIICQSMREGIWPDQWKTANVIPVNKEQFGNRY